MLRSTLLGTSRCFRGTLHARYFATEQNIDFKQLTNNNKVVVFMKGTPEKPKCGFSNAVIQILRVHRVSYDSHDVLMDESMREGIKEFTNWPTIPQVFIGGEFIGGCDILIEMHQKGDLIQVLDKVGIKSALIEKPAKQTKNSLNENQ